MKEIIPGVYRSGNVLYCSWGYGYNKVEAMKMKVEAMQWTDDDSQAEELKNSVLARLLNKI